VLQRRTFVLWNESAVFVDQPDVSRDPIRAISGDLDLWHAFGIRKVRIAYRVDTNAKRARRTLAHRIHQIVQSRATR
jgi:hypothetical protein